MRVSVEKDDPGYAMLQRLGGRCNVYLDGHPIRAVLTADTDAGEVLVFRLDLNGQPVIAADGETWETEIIQGAVIVMPDEHQGQA